MASQNRADEDVFISPLGSPLQDGSAPVSPRSSRISFHSATLPAGRRQESGINTTRNKVRKQVLEPEPETETSGDETTAIINRERGGGRNPRSYLTGRSTSTGNSLRPRVTSTGSRLRSQVDGPAENHDDDAEPPLSGWRKFLEKYGSVELENKGSVARDHLALERTFLAWLRTSLSFASIGIAITQLFRLNTTINKDSPTHEQLKLRHVGRPLGATFLAVGILTLLVGFHRYFESQHYVIQGKFPASRGSVIIMAFCSAALIIASFVVVLILASNNGTNA